MALGKTSKNKIDYERAADITLFCDQISFGGRFKNAHYEKEPFKSGAKDYAVDHWFLYHLVAPKGAVGFGGKPTKWVYLLLVYLVTALVPSLTACLASSPGRSSLMAVWISRELMVDFLL